jgi:hypothetical protein
MDTILTHKAQGVIKPPINHLQRLIEPNPSPFREYKNGKLVGGRCHKNGLTTPCSQDEIYDRQSYCLVDPIELSRRAVVEFGMLYTRLLEF